MFDEKDHTQQAKKNIFIYCDEIIIAALLIIIISSIIFFDVNLYSVFDLSKITVVSILTFTILAIWSVKTIMVSYQNDKCINNYAQTEDGNSSCKTKGINLSRHSSSWTGPFQLAQPLNLPILAFLCVCSLATIFSINPYVSLVGTFKRYGGLISTIVYVCLFYAIVNFIGKKRSNIVLITIILTACLASIYGVFQHFGLDLYKWSTTFGFEIRSCSSFGHPAFFSAFLIMVIPLVLVKIFSCNERSKICLYIGVLALLLVALCYTKTRASLLGLVISNIFFFSSIGKKILLANKRKTVMTFTVLLGILFYYNVSDKSSPIRRVFQDITPVLSNIKSDEIENSRLNKDIAVQVSTGNKQHEAEVGHLNKDQMKQESFSSLPEVSEEDNIIVNPHVNSPTINVIRKLKGSTYYRSFQYLTGITIVRDYPILGIGLDTLGIIYPEYLKKLYMSFNQHKDFVNQNRIHNDFLDVTISTGFLGLGVYLWSIFAYSKMIWKGAKESEVLDRILIIGLCSGCLAYFIQNQFSFGHIPIITIFWFLIGLSVIACREKTPVADSLNTMGNTLTNDTSNTINVQHGKQTNATTSTSWFNNYRYKRYAKILSYVLILQLSIFCIVLCVFRYKADIYFCNGQKLKNKKLMPEAIGNFKKAVTYNPMEKNYRNVLSGTYLRMAVDGLNESREDDKNNKAVSQAVSRRKDATNWLTNSIDGAMKVQKLYPKDYLSAFTLGQAYHVLDGVSKKDLSSEVIKRYKHAISLHPYKFQLRDKLAQVYYEKGRYPESIKELKNALLIEPGSPSLHINIAVVYAKYGMYKEARDSYNFVLKSKGANKKLKEVAKKRLDALRQNSK